jgi:Bacterial EndoU nuclease
MLPLRKFGYLFMQKKTSETFQLPKNMLQHLLYGEIKRGKSFGIHFFQKGTHQIIEITKSENELGVWEALVAVAHPRTMNWVRKKKPSTFFPTSWDAEILLNKLQIAFDNKERITAYKFIGKTDCGISIHFLFQEGQCTSCYPVY